MRLSSPTCRKRSGKMRSVITLMPSPRHSSAMSWACRSVGKPGYGWVVISTGLSRAAALTKIVPFCALDLHADFFEAIDDRDQVVEVAVLELQLAVGDGGGDHERAALDAVGDDAVLGSRSSLSTPSIGSPACRGR